MKQVVWCSCVALCLLAHRATGQPKDLVYPGATAELVEAVLKDQAIVYNKRAGEKQGAFYYDFERAGHKVRLINFAGKDLWITAHFPPADLDAVNTWNQRARFSRAVRLLEKNADHVALEAQLDCRPGATAGIIRQFLRRFEAELAQYAKMHEAP